MQHKFTLLMIKWFIPRRARRLLYLSSCAGHLCQHTYYRALNTQILNQHMHLVHTVDALDLGIVYHEKIWQSTSFDTLDVDHLADRQLAICLVNISPIWVRYTYLNMLEDTNLLIRILKEM